MRFPTHDFDAFVPDTSLRNFAYEPAVTTLAAAEAGVWVAGCCGGRHTGVSLRDMTAGSATRRCTESSPALL